MRRGGEGDQGDGRPEIGRPRGKDDRRHRERAHQHRCLPRAVDSPTAGDEERRQPSTGDAARVGGQEDRHQWRAER